MLRVESTVKGSRARQRVKCRGFFHFIGRYFFRRRKNRPENESTTKPDTGFSEADSARILTEEQRLRRYFSHEPDWLTSMDGVTFVVNNQWTYWNIIPVVKFAQEQGYDVIEYK